IFDYGDHCEQFGFLPGQVIFEEGQALPPDENAVGVYNNIGKTYDFYREVFKRDSLDNAGEKLFSTVHFNAADHYNNGQLVCSPNVSAWYEYPSYIREMIFGDGDGHLFSSLGLDLNVVAHEYTHGINTVTARLNFMSEPGALSEATSDIMAECV